MITDRMAPKQAGKAVAGTTVVNALVLHRTDSKELTRYHVPRCHAGTTSSTSPIDNPVVSAEPKMSANERTGRSRNRDTIHSCERDRVHAHRAYRPHFRWEKDLLAGQSPVASPACLSPRELRGKLNGLMDDDVVSIASSLPEQDM